MDKFIVKERDVADVEKDDSVKSKAISIVETDAQNSKMKTACLSSLASADTKFAEVSTGSISEVDRRALNADLPVSTTFAGGLRYVASYSPHLRRSLPNMSHSMSTEPAKIYPYHLLHITNYRLPADCDRLNLERHLSDTEFEAVFQCSRVEFYRLPQWRRNDLKRRARLF